MFLWNVKPVTWRGSVSEKNRVLKCKVVFDSVYDFFFFTYLSHVTKCGEVRFSCEYWVAAWTSFQVCIQVYHVKSVRNTGLQYLQKLMWLLWKLELFRNLWTSSVSFVSSNCGVHFYCEPVFCVESVMNYSLLHGMMLELWQSCLSFSRPLYLLCLTVFSGVFIKKNIFKPGELSFYVL